MSKDSISADQAAARFSREASIRTWTLIAGVVLTCATGMAGIVVATLPTIPVEGEYLEGSVRDLVPESGVVRVPTPALCDYYVEREGEAEIPIVLHGQSCAAGSSLTHILRTKSDPSKLHEAPYLDLTWDGQYLSADSRRILSRYHFPSVTVVKHERRWDPATIPIFWALVGLLSLLTLGLILRAKPWQKHGAMPVQSARLGAAPPASKSVSVRQPGSAPPPPPPLDTAFVTEHLGAEHAAFAQELEADRLAIEKLAKDANTAVLLVFASVVIAILGPIGIVVGMVQWGKIQKYLAQDPRTKPLVLELLQLPPPVQYELRTRAASLWALRGLAKGLTSVKWAVMTPLVLMAALAAAVVWIQLR